MNKLEIDYSEVTPVTGNSQETDWEPPVHKYFGRKLPNGKFEKEPVYVHQEYPRLMYAQKNGKITAKVVHSDAERDSLGEGWEKTPAAFGYIGAPSFEQMLQMREPKASTEEAQAEAPRRGRPPKGE